MDSEAKIADALHFALRGRRQIAPGARASTYFGRSRDTAAFEQGMDHWCLDGYDETRIHLVIRGVTGRPQTYRSSTDLQVVHRLTKLSTDLQGRPQTHRAVHRPTRSSTDLQGRTQTYKVVHEPQVSCTFLRAVRRSPHFLSAPSTCIVPYPFLFPFSRNKTTDNPL